MTVPVSGTGSRPDHCIGGSGPGRGHRPVGCVPEGVADVAAARRGVRGRVSPSDARQRDGDRGEAASDSGDQGPERTCPRSGLGESAAAPEAPRSSPTGRGTVSRSCSPSVTRPEGFTPPGRSRSNCEFCCTPAHLREDAAAKAELERMVLSGQPEARRLYRTVCRWWNEIEVLIVTGATTAKVEENNTAIKHFRRSRRDTATPETPTTYPVHSATRTAA